MSKLEAVIFDLDGVILNSEPLHFEADRLTMADYGRELPEEVLIAYVGVSGPDMWADLIGQYAISDSLANIIKKQKAHKKALLQGASLTCIPGIPELLQCIRGAWIPIALASSSPRDFIEAVIDHLGITAYFDAVVSGEEVERGKPAPDIFLRAAELLHVQSRSCAVIEDSGHGVRAAKAAGMLCVGFVNPTSGPQDLSPADIRVHSFHELDMDRLKSIFLTEAATW